jgi:hypothetical protein
MNERIQTLLAKFKETESTHRGAHVLMGLNEIEKFAELIVRECIELNKQELAFNAFERMLNRYREHFGVEE